jgi:HEAT repeat protein
MTRLLVTIWLAAGSVAMAEIRPEFAMETDPELHIPPPVRVFSEANRVLWLQAVSRPEADMQRMAALTIARAHLVGMPNLSEARPALAKIVSAESTHPAARFAAARALIVLDIRDEAVTLFAASQRSGSELRQEIEPALGRWKFQPMIEAWHKRLAASDVRHRDLMLAIRGVADADDTASADAVLTILHDPLRPAAVRLAAARSAGRLRDSGLEGHAERLLTFAAASVLDRLEAVALLEHHRSEPARRMLLRLATDREPSVAAAALATLNSIDHDLVLPLAGEALSNGDANVRRQGVDAYVARPTPERVVAVARLLDDPHQGLRAVVREELYRLAQTPELNGPIRQTAVEVLGGESWRGQEQSALLLAELDHEPAAARLVQLLESPRPAVTVAAAWGLRKLAVPDTLPAILDKATRQTESRLTNRPPPNELDFQVGHLFEALGLMRYAPAEPLLRRYVPKDMSMGELSRGGAIWALGHLHADSPDEALARQLVERLTEPDGMNPSEKMRVRLASAISLGRMGAKSQVDRMRQYMGPVSPYRMSLTLRWAIETVTGESIPAPKPPVESITGWFLESIREPPPGDLAP